MVMSNIELSALGQRLGEVKERDKDGEMVKTPILTPASSTVDPWHTVTKLFMLSVHTNVILL